MNEIGAKMSVAWIKTTLPSESDNELLKTYQQITGFDDTEKIEKRIRNNFIALSIKPNLLRDSWNFMHNTSFKNKESRLTKQDRDLIDTIVSISNRCRFCTIGHAEVARGNNQDVDFTQQLKSDYKQLNISKKLIAALEFAEQLTSHPDKIKKNDVEKLSKVGWSDEDIADIVHETALFNYMNRIVIGLGVNIHPFMERIEERDKEFLDTSNW
jgi:uncharacterized peroxidase-related enzyme